MRPRLSSDRGGAGGDCNPDTAAEEVTDAAPCVNTRSRVEGEFPTDGELLPDPLRCAAADDARDRMDRVDAAGLLLLLLLMTGGRTVERRRRLLIAVATASQQRQERAPRREEGSTLQARKGQKQPATVMHYSPARKVWFLTREVDLQIELFRLFLHRKARNRNKRIMQTS